jgi:hypothetical protein
MLVDHCQHREEVCEQVPEWRRMSALLDYARSYRPALSDVEIRRCRERAWQRFVGTDAPLSLAQLIDPDWIGSRWRPLPTSIDECRVLLWNFSWAVEARNGWPEPQRPTSYEVFIERVVAQLRYLVDSRPLDQL